MSRTARPHDPRPPHRTVRLRPDSNGPVEEHPDTGTTDYELASSVHLPAARLEQLGRAPRSRPLDAETRAVFQHRLRLCCLVAAAPFGFFLVCAATNVIHLFGRGTVGWPGLVLSALTLAGLLGTAAFLSLRRNLPENALRVTEVAVFGTMGLYFAYWHYLVLTAAPAEGPAGEAEQLAVLAAVLIVHFNWFALLIFHGMLVPNTLARGLGVVVAMCSAALAIDTVAAVTHPPTSRNLGALVAVASTMLAAGAGLSVVGTAKTEALRRQVLTARETIRELGQYRLRRKLGQGGMGEVYLAEHQLLKRPCALKRIHPKYLHHPEQVRRFEREVQATAALRHPNTVEIYDYGQAEDGTFYYVMEYLRGMSLEEVVGRYGPLPPERTIHVLRQVCGALREAHRYGLVHRDIKPSNILILPDGSPHDQVKLLDFGLVHSLTDEIDPTAKITREGLIVGTPEYMSPEQASGSPLDGRSDLFSVGSVLYYLLTGTEAFHRENPMKTLLAVVQEEPAPVSARNPNVPDDLLAVLGRCLTKTVGERFERAADLDAALFACRCSVEWTERRAAEWWAAHAGGLKQDGTDLTTLPLQESDGE